MAVALALALSTALLSVLQLSAQDKAVEVILNKIIEVAYDILSCDMVRLFFVDTVRQDVYCVVSPDSKGFALPLGKGIAGLVASTGGVGVLL